MNAPTDSIAALLDKGVRIPHPQSVFVSPDVDPERVHASVTLHPGTRLQGPTLSIGPECDIGSETPATVINCQLGHGVTLAGGFFQGSVFLDGSSVGSAAHVRPGCLLEEEASAAHAVGLKQTILYPFVTLGSLINFCDVWMSGGTSRKDHSEVGSSFIHFNFTPHGDKATASLIGDPAEGLLLNQPPVFLGGQGGIVGPIETAHGVIQAAGSVCRRDLLEAGHLYQSGSASERWPSYTVGEIKTPQERIRKNLRYIGSLVALRDVYLGFRMRVMARDPFTVACLEGAVDLLGRSVEERVKQLNKLLELVDGFSWLSDHLAAELERDEPSSDLRKLAGKVLPTFGNGYIGGLQALDPADGAVMVHAFKRQQQRFADLADRD
jgi:UDP-N-acetylglucosamine/UDP-N-acetylgalactosamine diphosphorylase